MRNFKQYILYQEDVQNKLPVLLKQFPNFTENDIMSIAEYDPTGKTGKYVPWMLKLASKGNITFPEDGPKVKEGLEQFLVQYKSSEFTGSKDINSYKTFGDLAETLDENEGVASKTLTKKIKQEQGVDIIYNKRAYKIFKITTKEAAAKLCRHTKWCIKDTRYSIHYLNRGPLYMITKNQEPYILFHFETGSIKDVYDRPISREMALEIYPIMLNFQQFREIKFNDISDSTINYIVAGASDPSVLSEFIVEEDVMELFSHKKINDLKNITLYDILSDAIHPLIESSIEMIQDDDEYMDNDNNVRIDDFTIFSDKNWNI